jgi:glycosyltransferase involved in cell wall biosynthesis
MKSLSVITVTYNAALTLERTLKSVREQTYPHIEHLIVDGESKDNTVALIQQYAQEKMVWVSEPDQGLYDAMNKAAGMASGDYLCFLNAGDTFFAPDSVEKMMHTMDPDNAPDIIYGETAIVDERGAFLSMRRLKAPDRLTWKSFRQKEQEHILLNRPLISLFLRFRLVRTHDEESIIDSQCPPHADQLPE